MLTPHGLKHSEKRQDAAGIQQPQRIDQYQSTGPGSGQPDGGGGEIMVDEKGNIMGAYNLVWKAKKITKALAAGKIENIEEAVRGNVPEPEAKKIHKKVHGAGLLILAGLGVAVAGYAVMTQG